MRSLSAIALLSAAFAVPAFGQSTTPPPATTVAVPADASNPSIDYAALRESVAQKNKALNEQVATQRAIVKKNQELLKEAQKLQAANQKLEEESRKLEAQRVDLEKQREALKSAQKPVETPAP